MTVALDDVYSYGYIHSLETPLFPEEDGIIKALT